MSDSRAASGETQGRTILFLQGLASPFFGELARTLAARGHDVKRIHLCLGDHMFWQLPSRSYRGSLAGWRAYLTAFLSAERVTDIVLFGDCRPYHRIAISLAAHRRVQVHVFEEGYLRPHWITVERSGVNGHSSLPRDVDLIRELAAATPPRADQPFTGSFVRRAFWDVSYNIANLFGRPAYPGYRRHRPHHVLVEYAGWLRRIARGRAASRFAEEEVQRAVTRPGGFFLVPLQLDSDYQIRVHSRFANLREFIEEVCASFANEAPPEAELLVKIHPLDNGLIDRRAQVNGIARRHGVADRVRCIDGGYLPTLLVNTRGVVVVNSTVGTSALEVGKPTIAMGTSIYNLPGLTFQDGIDRFWSESSPPDPSLFDAFRRLVAHRTQVNGGYFCKAGVELAVAAAADRVEAAEPLLPSWQRRERRSAGEPAFYSRPQPAE